MAFTLDPLYERQSWLDTQRHVYLLIGFSVASHMILLTTTVISIMAVVLDVGFVVLGFMVHQQIFHITQQSDYQNVALPRQTKDAMYTAFVLRFTRPHYSQHCITELRWATFDGGFRSDQYCHH